MQQFVRFNVLCPVVLYSTIASFVASYMSGTKKNLLAYNQASVLIYGESGVGKSFLAEYIQKSGSLSGKPFVKISCSAISEELFASELFGYSPNAFTGASASGKTGLLEAADHGTVLFDEINELSPHCQTLLLHFLQNKI